MREREREDAVLTNRVRIETEGQTAKRSVALLVMMAVVGGALSGGAVEAWNRRVRFDHIAPLHCPICPEPPTATLREPECLRDPSGDSARIVGGIFQMGSDDVHSGRPALRITVGTFFLDKTEVSRWQYQHCLSCSPPSAGPRCNRPNNAIEYPVNCVSHAQASNYCRSHGGRLPTEAEWEFAARGPSGRRFPWLDGSITHSRANVESASLDAVTSHIEGASPEQVLNLIGNVWEWTASADPPFGSNVPVSDEDSVRYVIRGGGYDDAIADTRSTERDSLPASDSQRDNVGFRCAYDVR